MKYVLSGPMSVAPGNQDGAEVLCPNGMAVVGGGVYLDSEDIRVSINTSYPFDNSPMQGGFVPKDGWAAYVNNPTAADVPFAVYAVCTSASSVS